MLKKAGLSHSDTNCIVETGIGKDVAPNADSEISVMGADPLGGRLPLSFSENDDRCRR